jgi:HEAT repeat protein
MNRTAAALAAMLLAPLLVSCASDGTASTASTPPPAAGDAAGGAGAAASPAGVPPTPRGNPETSEERLLLYQRVAELSSRWERATTEGHKEDARGYGLAAAKEVWDHIDTVLDDLANSSNPRWRETAARGLGFVKNPRVLPALQPILKEPDARLLAAALVSLALESDVDTDERQVAPLLSHADPVVRGDAALCLAKVFAARDRLQLPTLKDSSFGPELEAELMVLIFDKDDPIVRGNACQALGRLGSEGAEEALLNRLKDDSSFVRTTAAQALAQCGTQRSYPGLLDALAQEENANVRDAQALALGSISEKAGLHPPLSDLGTNAVKWRLWLKR